MTLAKIWPSLAKRKLLNKYQPLQCQPSDPAKPRVLPQKKHIKTNHQEYELHNTPKPLQQTRISKCTLEYLETWDMINLGRNTVQDDDGHSIPKNKVILRIHFSHPVHQGKEYAPRGTTGLLLDIRPHGPAPEAKYRSMESRVYVKTIGYKGDSPGVLHSVDLARDQIFALKDIIYWIERRKMLGFWFIFEGNGFVGCRHFMTQLIRQLREEYVLRLSFTEIVTVNDSLNLRDGPEGVSWEDRVQSGWFPADYMPLPLF